MNSTVKATLYVPSRPMNPCIILLYIARSLAALWSRLPFSGSLGPPPRLLFFFFFIFHGRSAERAASISVWFQKRKTPESSSLSGAYALKGNGLNPWFRQSCSLLALQKKSAQVFLVPQMLLYSFHLLSDASFSLCLRSDLPRNDFIFFDPRSLIYATYFTVYSYISEPLLISVCVSFSL